MATGSATGFLGARQSPANAHVNRSLIEQLAEARDGGDAFDRCRSARSELRCAHDTTHQFR